MSSVYIPGSVDGCVYQWWPVPSFGRLILASPDPLKGARSCDGICGDSQSETSSVNSLEPSAWSERGQPASTDIFLESQLPRVNYHPNSLEKTDYRKDLFNSTIPSKMRLILDTNHLGLKSLAIVSFVWLGWYIYSSLKFRARMNKLGKRAVIKRSYLPFGIDTMVATTIVLFSLNYCWR